jgi:hypothetical protein
VELLEDVAIEKMNAAGPAKRSPCHELWLFGAGSQSESQMFQ